MLTTIFDNAAALYDAAVYLFAAAVSSPSKTPKAVIVPGGNTPKPLFERLAACPLQIGPWFYLGLTDERMVPDTDPAGNYGLVAPMIKNLGLSAQRILRVDTTLELEAAAKAYDGAWNAFFDNEGAIALAFLGLGEDGHTCSLFSPEQARNCPANSLAAAVLRPRPPHRVTITPALLRRVQHIVFLATGSSKEAMVEAMTRDPESVAAGIAVQGCSRSSLWYTPE